MFFYFRHQDVGQHPAAATGSGTAEEGGKHQENLSQPGCRGYQGKASKLNTVFYNISIYISKQFV